MSQPQPLPCQAITADLSPGTYYWCACGLSKEQPFCDGSHIRTSCRPLRFVLPAPRRLSLCLCKRTLAPPACDHSCEHPPAPSPAP